MTSKMLMHCDRCALDAVMPVTGWAGLTIKGSAGIECHDLCAQCLQVFRSWMRPAKSLSGRAKGGLARAAALSPERRSEIAREAVAARWNKKI